MILHRAPIDHHARRTRADRRTTLFALAHHSLPLACGPADIEFGAHVPFASGTKLGPYRISVELGEGGMDRVRSAVKRTPGYRRPCRQEMSLMPKSVNRRLQICLVLCALFMLSSPAAETQPAPASADARLRALYTEEWKWRQQEVARSDQYS